MESSQSTFKLIKLFHHSVWSIKKNIYRQWKMGPWYQRYYHLDKIKWRVKGNHAGAAKPQLPSKGVVAITCSAYYTEVLEIVIRENSSFFDKWIIVTDPKDIDTVNLLKKHPEIITLLFDFTSRGNGFNKGGGIRLAQKYAYENYPNQWYLILDSDICIRSSKPIDKLEKLESEAIYLCNDRRNFKKLSDFRQGVNFEQFLGDVRAGFFQLYRKKYFYIDWPTAGRSDIAFANDFSDIRVLRDLSCDHLGEPENYDGKNGPRFLIDESRD